MQLKNCRARFHNLKRLAAIKMQVKNTCTNEGTDSMGAGLRHGREANSDQLANADERRNLIRVVTFHLLCCVIQNLSGLAQ